MGSLTFICLVLLFYRSLTDSPENNFTGMSINTITTYSESYNEVEIDVLSIGKLVTSLSPSGSTRSWDEMMRPSAQGYASSLLPMPLATSSVTFSL